MIILKRAILTVAGLCLIINNVFAEVNWQKFSYFENFGGLNDNLSETEIADNEAADIQNIVFDTGGAIKKRYGSLTIPSNPVTKVMSGAITGLTFYKKDNGSRYLVAVANNDDNQVSVKKKDYAAGGGWTNTTGWDFIEGSGLPTGYDDDNLVDFTIAEDNLVFSFDAVTQTKPYKWTGTGNVSILTSDADCPVATILEYHKNHLFLAGDDSYPSRVYFSALDDITDYTATDFFDVQTSDGSRVRGMVSAYNALYFLKDRSIWRLSGTNRDDFVLEKMVQGIGTLSQQSIAIVGNVIQFTTAQNDTAIYDGGYSVVFSSQKIRNTINNLNFARATNTLGLAFSTYRYNDYDYYVSCSSSGNGTNNRVLFFDTYFKAWSKFVGINANAWCVAENSVGKNILTYGDYDGYVHYYPSTTYADSDGNDTTNPIVAFYETKWFRYPEVSLGDKYWRLLKTYALSETTVDSEFTAECRSDYETTGTAFTVDLDIEGSLWDVSLWDTDRWGGSALIVDREEVEKGTSMFQIKFSDSDLNEGFTILGFENFIERADRI